MFRRIEILKSDGIWGLMGITPDEVVECWWTMKGPQKKIRKNVRFYFTEKGWDLYGRKTVKALMRTKTPYRVIAREEHSVSIQYRDAIQVTIFPKKKGRK